MQDHDININGLLEKWRRGEQLQSLFKPKGQEWMESKVSLLFSTRTVATLLLQRLQAIDMSLHMGGLTDNTTSLGQSFLSSQWACQKRH